jgi:uncharacterized membrane protein YfcA
MIYIVVGSITGLLIGAVGIGGILLAPMLVYLAGVDLHLAMSTSSLSFLFTGIAGTIAYARRRTIAWNMVGWLSLGLVPATIIGARTNVALQAENLTIVLAILTALSGLNTLLRKDEVALTGTTTNRLALVSIGLAVGFGSALTGTGGPVLLLPILLILKTPALVAIGVSQAIQLPIAAFASVGFTIFGEIDIGLGAMLGVVQAIAVVVGAQIAHRTSARRLRLFVAIALVAAGLLLIARVLT